MSSIVIDTKRARERFGALACSSLLLSCFVLCIFCFSLAVGQQQLRPPRIKEHPASVIVKKHEPAKLECKADGNPPPKIEWYKDNEKVYTTPNRMVLDNSLVFLHVISKKGDTGDIGTYYCLARNEVGKAKSRNATLEVALLREEFRLMPENTRAAVGETAVFECIPPRGHPEPVVSWIHNEHRIDLSNGRFKLNGHNLVISAVTQRDHGQYRCVAQNMLGTRESPPAILKVLVKPYFIRAPEDVTAMSGEDIVFQCKVGGDPVPTITWKREDGKMLNARSQILEDKALRITHVRPSDEGTYVCEVENSAGQMASSASLAVNSLPSFVTTPKSVQVTASNVAKMECLVTGNPQPVYFWSKEGTQVLMFPGNTYGKFGVSNDGTLSISNVEKEDQGFYICSAVSRVGSAITRAFLSVVVLNEVPPPIIRLGAANQTLPELTKAFLPCEATGFPQATIKWFFNQKPIHNDTHFTVTFNSLQIQNIHQSDTGTYTCVASSASGMTTWNSRLLVESPRNPNINFHKMPDPSTFPEPPSKPVVVNATETTLTIMWERFGSSGASHHLGSMLEYYSPDIKSGWVEVARRIHADIITVRNLRPNTRYMFVVRAENKHGIGYPSSVSDEMQTLDPFNSHTMADVDINQARSWLNDVNIKLRDIRTISSVSVKLVWTVVGNAELVDGYYIRYQNIRNELQSNKFNMVTVFGGSTPSYILTDLRKFAKYQFFIVPFFKNIEGKPSNTLTVKTYEDVPSSPPLSITVKAVNISCALVEWTPPSEENQNGHLMGYHLQIYENNTLLYANLTVDASYNSIILYNLSLGSFYSIRALAFTTIGNGPFSPPVYLNMESALRNSFEDIHLQPSYQHGYPFNQIWFFVFIVLILIILLTILVKIVFIYTHRKTNKSTYEKANSLNENYSDNFVKYDSTSSKYSSFPDNNEYAEVNDLKSYGENQEKITLVPYAMTPLIEKTNSSSNSSRASYNHSRATFLGANDDLVSESLLNERKQNYSNGCITNVPSSINRANYLQRVNQATLYEQDLDISSNIQLNNLPQRVISQMGNNDYETANDTAADKHNSSLEYEDNLSDFERNSISHEFKKNQRNIVPTKYSIHPDPGRAFFEYKDNKLSTFSSNGSSSPRIILNPIDGVSFESSPVNHRNDDLSNEVNHYLVSEELCKLPLNNFNTDSRGKPRHEFPVRYNMSLSNDFGHTNSPYQHNGRRNELSIHDQFVKNKVQSKKRNSRPALDLCESDHR